MNPFAGPRPLSSADPIFGRDRELRELEYLLTSQRIVVLHSPSGAGKSSLLNAKDALLDHMREKLTVWPVARVKTAPPEPVANRFVWSAITDFAGGKPGPGFGEMTLAQYTLTRITEPTLLVFDQFEEILRVDPVGAKNIEIKQEFFRQLGDLLMDKRIWCLIVLRDDFLGPLTPYRKLVPTHLQNRYRIDLLNCEAASLAIQGTARKGGRQFTADALKTLVNNLSLVKVEGSETEEPGDYIEPLQLQVVCRDLWGDGTGDITLDQVQSGGSIDKALGNYYATAVNETAKNNERDEYRIRQWVGTHLITLLKTRDQVRREMPSTAGLETTLVDALVDTHLVRLEERLGGKWLELAHDRLIEPVRKSNAEWFESKLNEWEKRARSWQQEPDERLKKTYLVAGADRAAAMKWAKENPGSRVDMTGYLAACGEYQGELDRKRREVLRLRIALACSALLLILACFAINTAVNAQSHSVYLLEQARSAEKESSWEGWISAGDRFSAQLQRDRAQGARAAAEKQRLIAVRARKNAEESSRSAIAARLLTEARQLETQGAFHKGLLLAIESYRRNPGPEALEVIRGVSRRVLKPVFLIASGVQQGISASDALKIKAALASPLESGVDGASDSFPPVQGKPAVKKVERNKEGLVVTGMGQTVWLHKTPITDHSQGYAVRFDATGTWLAHSQDGYLNREFAGRGYDVGWQQIVSVYAGALQPPSVFHCTLNLKKEERSFGMAWTSSPRALAVMCQDGSIKGLEAPDWTRLDPITQDPTFNSDGSVGDLSNSPVTLTSVAAPDIPPGAQTIVQKGDEDIVVYRAGRKGGEKSPLIPTSLLRIYKLPLGTVSAVNGDGTLVAAWVAAPDLKVTVLPPRHREAAHYEPAAGLALIDTVNARLARPILPLDGAAAKFSPSGRYLVIAGNDAFLRLLEVKSGKIHQVELKAGLARIANHAVFSGDEERLAVLSRDGIVHVYDCSTATEQIRMQAPPGLIDKEAPSSTYTVNRMAFSVNGKELLFLVEDGWQAGLKRETLDPDVLLRDACSRVSRNLTQEEWKVYFGAEPFRNTCQTLNPAAMGQPE